MAVRRSLAHLPAFVLAGTGTLPLLIGLASRWGWLALPNQFVVVLALLTGTGIGLLSWLGFELGRRRWRRASTSGTSSAGQEARGASLRSRRRLRGFALSVLGFLVLGTLYGLIDT